MEISLGKIIQSKIFAVKYPFTNTSGECFFDEDLMQRLSRATEIPTVKPPTAKVKRGKFPVVGLPTAKLLMARLSAGNFSSD